MFAYADIERLESAAGRPAEARRLNTSPARTRPSLVRRAFSRVNSHPPGCRLPAVRDPFFHQTLAQSGVPTDRTDESLFKAQPFARVGYAVTDRLQPVGDDGRPLASNAFVAGGAIAGYDPAGTKSRGGLAIATGYRAAQEAMAA